MTTTRLFIMMSQIFRTPYNGLAECTMRALSQKPEPEPEEEPLEVILQRFPGATVGSWCRVCSDRLPAGEVICERHLTEPLDDRWSDLDG